MVFGVRACHQRQNPGIQDHVAHLADDRQTLRHLGSFVPSRLYRDLDRESISERVALDNRFRRLGHAILNLVGKAGERGEQAAQKVAAKCLLQTCPVIMSAVPVQRGAHPVGEDASGQIADLIRWSTVSGRQQLSDVRGRGVTP